MATDERGVTPITTTFGALKSLASGHRAADLLQCSFNGHLEQCSQSQVVGLCATAGR